MAQKQFQARAEFDFDAQPGSGELSIHTGEILTILKEGIDGGWVEGRNIKGKVGLFPASYIKMLGTPQSLPNTGNVNSGPPPIAPPPLPSVGSSGGTGLAAAPTYALPPEFDSMSSAGAGSAAPSTSIYPSVTQKPTAPSAAPPPLPGFDAWDDPSPAAPFGRNLPKNDHIAVAGTGGGSVNKTMSSDAMATTFDDDFDDEWSDEDEEVANGQKKLQKEDNGHVEKIGTDERGNISSEAEEQQQPGSHKSRATAAGISSSHRSLDVQSDLEAESPTGQEFIGAHSFAAGSGAASSKMVARSRSTGPETASISNTTSSKLSSTQSGGTTRMRNLNRFSNFVKTGMEGYILATAKIASQPGEHHKIVLANGGGPNSKVEWHRVIDHYTCMVTKPKKESKLKGLRSFIAYSLTSSMSGIQVSRRYKHFDWLHLQLSNKYLLIPIPPLPEKQVAGRYEEDLIEHRRSILQLWVNKICRHPVLNQSEVWNHFLTCTDEAKWKKGKRQAEKDEYVGGNFLICVSAPDQTLDSANVERQIEQFARCSRSLEETCRNMYERVVETQKRMIGPYKGNWQKMGAAFDALGQSLDLDQTQPNNPVKNAIKTSANFLHKIGAQHEEHGRKDLEQLLDFLFVSKGIYAGIPDTVNVHRSALAKMRENERLQNEGKISPEDAHKIRQRVDVCSYAMLAEIQHQQEERDLDLATMFGSYFSQQAAFYHNIGNQLTQLATLFKPAK